MAEYLPAMKLSELSDDSFSPTDVKGVHILLSKFGEEVYAVSGVCTHEETDLSIGFKLEDRVVCPLHLSQFSLKTGEVANPPAEAPLRRFNVKIDGGMIFVEV
ncbi:MAG TPA: Rieske 2Fe-2S domain-containing protein [Nitrososphaerales archaeon]|nr:Rieske 2Fe-2S domain-containing protein [Nitrososphaerales archaeon]